jgi:hypothetical protein
LKEREYLPAVAVQLRETPLLFYGLQGGYGWTPGIPMQLFSYHKKSSEFNLVASKKVSLVRFHAGVQGTGIRIKELRWFEDSWDSSGMIIASDSGTIVDEFTSNTIAPLFGIDAQIHPKASILAEIQTNSLFKIPDGKFKNLSKSDLYTETERSGIIGVRLCPSDWLRMDMDVRHAFTGAKETNVQVTMNVIEPFLSHERDIKTQSKSKGGCIWPVTGTVFVALAGFVTAILHDYSYADDNADSYSPLATLMIGTLGGGIVGYRLGESVRENNSASGISRGIIGGVAFTSILLIALLIVGGD